MWGSLSNLYLPPPGSLLSTPDSHIQLINQSLHLDVKKQTKTKNSTLPQSTPEPFGCAAPTPLSVLVDNTAINSIAQAKNVGVVQTLLSLPPYTRLLSKPRRLYLQSRSWPHLPTAPSPLLLHLRCNNISHWDHSHSPLTGNPTPVRVLMEQRLSSGLILSPSGHVAMLEHIIALTTGRGMHWHTVGRSQGCC